MRCKGIFSLVCRVASLPLAVIVILGMVQTANAVENFYNDAGNRNLSLYNYGWVAYGSPTCTDASNSYASVSYFSTELDSEPGLAFALLGNLSGSVLLATSDDESSYRLNVPVADLGSVTMSWEQWIGGTVDYCTSQLALKVDNTWYASVDTFSNAMSYTQSDSAVTAGGEFKSLAIANAAGWYEMTVDKGVALSVGSTPVNLPTAGTLVSAGFYFHDLNTSPNAVPLIDNFDTGTPMLPVPTPELPYTEDFNNNTGGGRSLYDYGWVAYGGPACTNVNASVSHYSTELDPEPGLTFALLGNLGGSALLATSDSDSECLQQINVPAADLDTVTVSWEQWIGGMVDYCTSQVALKIGETWFASADTFSNAMAYTESGSAVTSGGESKSLTLANATGWYEMTVNEGIALSIGSTPVDLPTEGVLTSVGFYFLDPNLTAVPLIDNVKVTGTTPEDPIPGDANKDGKVDGSDVTILAGNWQVLEDADWEMGDFNGDGRVDGSDVTILAGNWQAGVISAASSVPEPSILVLFIAGMISGMFIKLKRNVTGKM